MTKITSPERLREIKAAYERRQAAYERRVLVCGGAGCVSCHCQAVRDALEEAVEALGLGGRVRVMVTGCIGICAVGPVMVVEPDGVLYTSLDPERAALIARRHLLEGEIVEECTFYDHDQKRRIPHLRDIGFFREQVRIALRNCGQMEYASLEAYIARDGYAALAGALTQKPADVVEEIKRSGLRGRGGAGFPTGVKWEAGMNAAEGRKYMVCNADEGDPGAFMDRSILEGDPHSLIEGMLLGGYAIGASRGYVYVRAEYPLAVERLSNAIHQAREAGLLGEGILGSDFDFDLEIRIGAGAFVCGEETALMNSVEGRRGEPDQKPPFPFESGLFHCPTIINNVETLANVPAILFHGADWFRGFGTEKSPGTKVFALSGKINNTGLVEVPMGIPLGEILYTIGGGIPGGKGFKAIQSGGPSGGCLTRAPSTPPSITRAWPNSARSWDRAASSSWTRTPAWSIPPATSWTSSGMRAAANAWPAAWVPSACWRFWSASPRARACPKIWTCWRSWPPPCRIPPCAAWARPRPTPSFPPSSTSATSTKPTSTTVIATRACAPTSISRPAATPAPPRWTCPAT